MSLEICHLVGRPPNRIKVISQTHHRHLNVVILLLRCISYRKTMSTGNNNNYHPNEPNLKPSLFINKSQLWDVISRRKPQKRHHTPTKPNERVVVYSASEWVGPAFAALLSLEIIIRRDRVCMCCLNKMHCKSFIRQTDGEKNGKEMPTLV